MSNNCPICGKDDQIKKVSAIVQGGRTRSTGQMPVGYSYTDSDGNLRSGTRYENFSTTQTSDRAKMLLPPPPPKAPQGASEFRFDLIVSTITTLIFFLVGAGAFVSLIFKMFGIDFIEGQPSVLDLLVAAFLFLVSGFLCFVGIKKYIKYHERTTEAYRVESPMWEKAMKRWESLYYCERDDSIHAPGEGSAPVAGLMEYIGWRPYQKISIL